MPSLTWIDAIFGTTVEPIPRLTRRRLLAQLSVLCGSANRNSLIGAERQLRGQPIVHS